MFCTKDDNCNLNRLILSLALSDNPSQKELDALLSLWDIEVEGSERSLCLAVFKKRHPGLSFPSYTGPRLDGLIRFFHFKYASLLLELKPFLDKMADAHIPVLAMGDLAFCLSFKDDSHSIFHLNVAVPGEHLSAARKAASQNIYVEGRSKIYFDGSLDCSSGTKIFLPSREILFYTTLHKLELAARGEVGRASSNIPSLILDVHSLLNSALDYETVISLAKKEHTLPVLHSAVSAYNSLIPSELKISDFTLPVLAEKDWEDYCLLKEYNAKVLSPARQLRHAYPLSRLIKEPRCLFSWTGARFRFIILKNIRTKYLMETAITKSLNNDNYRTEQ